MKDRNYHFAPPWVVMPLVALTINCGLWISARNMARNAVSSRAAIPVVTLPTRMPGQTGSAEVFSNSVRIERCTSHPSRPATAPPARRRAETPIRLPQGHSIGNVQTQGLPPRSKYLLVGLDQVATQSPRLDPTLAADQGAGLPSLRTWKSPQLQPPANSNSTNLRPENELPRSPSEQFANETRPPYGPSDKLANETKTPLGPSGKISVEDQPPRLLEIPVTFRSRNMEQMAREADSHTRRGFDLAGRGAIFSARAEFAIALRMIAQGRDEDRRNTESSRALSAGITALEEAQDFLPHEASILLEPDLPEIIRRHATPVLRDAPLEDLSAHAALQCYFSFAQEQLAASAGTEVAGSMALYGLGKLHGTLGQQRVTGIRAALPQSVAFHQAAILVMPQNYLASNALGVLLVRGGRHEDARQVMQHSLAIHPNSVAWRNLGLVLWQLGQTESSRDAHRNYLECLQTEGRNNPHRSDSSGQPVRWIDPASFARLGDRLRNVRREERPSPQSRGQAARVLPPEPEIRLCQALGPAAPCNICGVDCSECDSCRSQGWESMRAIAWQAYAQGEYVGHDRLAHVPEYRLRVDDELDLVYRLTRDEMREPYRLNVGDEIRVESFTDQTLTRDLLIQPDGTITLLGLGQVRATGRTVAGLTEDLETLYQKLYNVPAITVTPLRVNTKLEDLRASVDRRQGFGGQTQTVKVTPEGTIALPAIGHVKAQSLTLPELQRELNERFQAEVRGMEVIPALVQRAPRYVYVLGEVAASGRFEMTGPTTAIQALALAGSWNVGAQLKQIVIFRRGDDWRLLATMIDLDAALHGKQPCPAGEIWLSDSDIVIVPKSPILVADDFIDLVFTRGIYGVFPMSASINFAKLSSL